MQQGIGEVLGWRVGVRLAAARGFALSTVPPHATEPCRRGQSIPRARIELFVVVVVVVGTLNVME